MPQSTILTLITGFVAGSALTFALCRLLVAARAGRAAEAARGAVREELATARTTAEQLARQRDDLDQRLSGTIREREQELAAVRAQLTAATATSAARAADLVQLGEMQKRLKELLDSLCAEALRHNNEAFLQLARTELERARTEADAGLAEKEKAIEALLAPVRASLEQYQQKVSEIERDRVESFGVLTERLQQVNESSAALKGETQHLVDALRTPHVRGAWGEVQLERVCELAGMLPHCDFTTQATVDTDDGALRPDLVVRLSGRRSIVVDAKTPLSAYLQALDATEPAVRRQCLERHAQQIRDHALALSRKEYWKQFEPAPEFVVLFLPGEALFSAALEVDPGLIEATAVQHVVLATPTTLIALLRTAACAWREESVARNAAEVSRLARELYERLSTMGDHFARVGRNLELAVKAYNDGIGSLESRVLVTARRIAEQGAFPSEEISVLEPVELLTRPLQAPEMIAPIAAGEEVPARR